MEQNPSHSRVYGTIRANLAASLLGIGTLVGAAGAAHSSIYQQIDLNTDSNANLVALGYPATNNPDNPDLINPWGISHSPTSPFWLSDNGTGLSTLYNGAGVKQALVVTIAPPLSPRSDFMNSSPTGQVHNPLTSGFNITEGTKTGSSVFIFATEDGTISGWNPNVDGTHSVVAIDKSQIPNPAMGAVYKGLAVAPDGSLLYAANFRAGTVEVYDPTFKLLKTITDPSVPAGFAPFNVQVLNGKLYVSFALQDAAKHDDVAGAGNGFVDVFNLDGSGMQRLISNGVLNSPWGLDIAPAGFGDFSNDLLVGNFGDGTINAFKPDGTSLGPLTDAQGNPIDIKGLWALDNGNNGPGFDPNAVYFTAGLPEADVPDVLEQAGLFGDLSVATAVVPEPSSVALLAAGLASIIWLTRRRRSSSIPVWIAAAADPLWQTCRL
jgi:uncharacterized protein (TIGR03118 family)